MHRKRFKQVLGSLALTVLGFSTMASVEAQAPRSVNDVVRAMQERVSYSVEADYQRAGVAYPPQNGLTFVILKAEKLVEVWAKGDQAWHFIRSYPILAASGEAGPKLRQGDCQVPEGIYQIPLLNPNSLYHLSMKLNYPNAFDQKMAQADGRSNLGGDIFIHGKDVSIGCVAIGDAAIEDLFVTVAQIGVAKVKVIIAPNDLRVAQPAVSAVNCHIGWKDQLYRRIMEELHVYRNY